VLPENSRVGFDPEEDRGRGYVVTESGITVVPSPVSGSQLFAAAGRANSAA